MTVVSDMVQLTYKVVDHRHEQVEKEWRATGLHFHLHRATTLEGAATAYDEGEVVCSQFRVAGGSVGIGKASRRQDSAAVDTGLETLLFQGDALQVGQLEEVGRALQISETGGEQRVAAFVDLRR